MQRLNTGVIKVRCSTDLTIQTYTSTHARTHAHTHAHTHTCTHARTHSRTRPFSPYCYPQMVDNTGQRSIYTCSDYAALQKQRLSSSRALSRRVPMPQLACLYRIFVYMIIANVLGIKMRNFFGQRIINCFITMFRKPVTFFTVKDKLGNRFERKNFNLKPIVGVPDN